MTNGWTDIRNADVILAMGGNPAENHPVGFRFVMEAKRRRRAKLVAVDPRYHRTAAVADCFVQIRAGTDIAFLGGLIHYALSRQRYHDEYVRLFTNATFLLKDTYAFDAERGLFSGWDAERRAYADTSSWAYELDARGFARTDPTMAHPRTVWQTMRAFYARYTSEAVAAICGCRAEDFERAADIITSTFTPDRAGTILYALGWTHHSHSVQLIHAAAMLQLLLGNIGRPGGGLNALRGHANIQGGTDCGMAYHNLPGYIPIPKADHPTLGAFLASVTPKPLRPGATNVWANVDRYAVSQFKAYYGEAAARDNGFGYDLHPRLPQSSAGGYDNWSWAHIFDRMYRGDMEGLLAFGMNPVTNGPHSRKVVSALSRLKWLVVAENFEQETAAFFRKDIQALVGKRPADVATEVFLLPAANFAEKDGSFVNSARWIQWKWKAVDPPGDAKPDQEIIARIFLAVRDLYEREGGRFPAPVRALNWWYDNPVSPSLTDVAREINGWAVKDVREGTGAPVRAGQQIARAADLRADGSTLSGNWLYAGVFTEAGNLAARRSTADPSGLGRYPEWAFSWPANRRILYNRCSADARGRPWDPARVGIAWNGQRWTGDTADYTADSPPEAGLGAFVMLPEGAARLFVPGQFVDGPWPEHYEPAESPVENPLHPSTSANPAIRRFSTEYDVLGTPADYPIVCTTYRLTEHFHYWTKNNPYAVQLQPEFFVEISEALAAEHRIVSGDRVRVTSARGTLDGKALVTKRLQPMTVAGRTVHQIGFPIHWGFLGRGAQQGALANLVTPTIVDPNSHAPEYKGFLVKLEKVAGA
jgi:formate dehydrogenase major subunit